MTGSNTAIVWFATVGLLVAWLSSAGGVRAAPRDPGRRPVHVGLIVNGS